MECTEPIDLKTQEGGKRAGPCVFVIFGASGDLTKRKLVPALFNLAGDGLLPDSFAIAGIATRRWTSDEFRKKICAEIDQFATGTITQDLKQWLVKRMHYLSGDFRDPKTYARLSERLHEIDKESGTGGNYLYYLATAPDFFAEIPRQLGAAGLTDQTEEHWRRLIVEKPFGKDVESARGLNRALRESLSESQIYRIDHYLGKETVQNILAFRFANGIFEPIWNRRYIDHVQITAAESVGVEGRGHYYDQSGALRDMVPNHIFQLISLTAMEPPISFQADAVHNEQVKVLEAIQPPSPEDVLRDAVRGQYDRGTLNGESCPAYRSEEDIRPNSNTPTYVAMKLWIDDWRWSGVPFYLRTGKRLPKRATEIAIRFKRPPFMLFRDTPVDHLNPNWLVMRLQPDEGIALSFGAKIPGAVMRLGNVEMDFCYQRYFGTTPQTGYERLLYDSMLGDATLFQHASMVETSWKVVAPILEVWEATPPEDFPNYATGTWGPQAADDLLARDRHTWRNCK